MICVGCHTIDHEHSTHCTWCRQRLYEYPWCVWWRYMRKGDTPSTAWHDVPKLYRSESAARMAERDLNDAYRWPHGRVQHIAIRRGVHPNELFV